MAYTRNWGELLNIASKLNKGLPWAGIDAVICDLVSSTIWTKYPWKESLTNIAPGWIPLADGVQDYQVPTSIFRLTKGWIVRSDVTPNEVRDVDVVGSIPIDLVPRSPYAIRSIAMQPAYGQIRLEGAVRIPTGSTWEVQGEYQLNPNKVTRLTDNVWFSDHYHHVGLAGLTYYAYKLGDDSRAGVLQKVENGRAVYTGQLAEFHASIDAMAAAEDYGGQDSLYPESNLAPGCFPAGGVIPIL